MDDDIWSINLIPDSQERNDYEGESKWNCDFYSAHGRDLIEEEALNAQSCIQALKKLITKADTEIDELEKDLVFLLIELAFSEHVPFSYECCNALKNNVDCLEIAINGLRNSTTTVTEARLLVHKEPAKKLQVILKTLLHRRFPGKYLVSFDF